LDFGISFSETSTTDSIDLIKEDNAGFLGPCHLEEFSDHSSTLTNISLNELRSDDSDKACISSIGHSSCCQSFTCSWWSVQENTFWRIDTKLSEFFWMQQRHLNNLSNFVNLIFASSQVTVCYIRLLFDRHHCNSWINFWWQRQFNLEL